MEYACLCTLGYANKDCDCYGNKVETFEPLRSHNFELHIPGLFKLIPLRKVKELPSIGRLRYLDLEILDTTDTQVYKRLRYYIDNPQNSLWLTIVYFDVKGNKVRTTEIGRAHLYEASQIDLDYSSGEPVNLRFLVEFHEQDVRITFEPSPRKPWPAPTKSIDLDPKVEAITPEQRRGFADFWFKFWGGKKF